MRSTSLLSAGVTTQDVFRMKASVRLCILMSGCVKVTASGPPEKYLGAKYFLNDFEKRRNEIFFSSKRGVLFPLLVFKHEYVQYLNIR